MKRQSTIPTPSEIVEWNQRIRTFEELWCQWCGHCGHHIRFNDNDVYMVGDYYYHACCAHFVVDKDGKLDPDKRREH